jgi:hypothetical protein
MGSQRARKGNTRQPASLHPLINAGIPFVAGAAAGNPQVNIFREAIPAGKGGTRHTLNRFGF